MSPDEPAESSEPQPAGLKPHHLAIALGVAIAVFTVISGVVPLITEWHNDNAVHREVFGGVPGPLQVAVALRADRQRCRQRSGAADQQR